MPNTIDSLGDRETLEAFISGRLTDYTDDTITELKSNFDWYYSGIATLSLPNLEYVYEGTLASSSSNLTYLNLPKLKYSRPSFIQTQCLGKLDSISLPELIIHNSISVSNHEVVNLPKLRYGLDHISLGQYTSILNLNSLETLNTIYINGTNSIFMRLELPKLQYLIGYNTSSTRSTIEYSNSSVFSELDLSNNRFKYIYIDDNFLYGSYKPNQFKLIIRSTVVPELELGTISTIPGKLNIFIPFFMMSKYLANSNWTQMASSIRPIESISNASNHQISCNLNNIPYYQEEIEYTCSLTCDYTNNVTGLQQSNFNISYNIIKNIGKNLSTTSITKTVSETFDQNLSFQITQSGIDFSNGYSVSGLRSFGWNEYIDDRLPQGYNYLQYSRNRYQLNTFKNGLNPMKGYTNYFQKIDSKLHYNEITIYINGISEFDFYMTCSQYNLYSMNGYYQNNNYYSYRGYVYIGDIDEDDPELSYKKRYQDTENGLDVQGISESSLMCYPLDSSYAYMTLEACQNISNWKHVEFTNIDPTVPHFIKIRSKVTNRLALPEVTSGTSKYLQRYLIAIPDTYTYNAIPMMVEDD